MSNKNELMLALWPNSDNRNYWRSEDSCRSMWMSLRSVEITRGEEGFTYDLNNYETAGVACRNVGLWLWASSRFSSVVELKGHDIHSASPYELTQLAKWLTKMGAKIAKADIPDSFGIKEKFILTLRSMGVRRAIIIDPDWRNTPRHKVVGLEEGLALKNYAEPLAEMESVRQRAYGSEAA